MGFILFNTLYEIVKSYTFLRKLIFIKYGGKNDFIRSKIPFLKDLEKILFGHPFYFRGKRKTWVNFNSNIEDHLIKALQRVFLISAVGFML